jgi:molecular chaperone Hsp31 and glyoxalase 3
MKKIVIGLVSIIVIAFIVLYFTSRPKLESDGSYSPSTLALALATVDVSDYENVTYQKYKGNKKKILVIFTEQRRYINEPFITCANVELCSNAIKCGRSI